MTFYHHNKTENGAMIMNVANEIVAAVVDGEIAFGSNEEIQKYCEEQGLVKKDKEQKAKEDIKDARDGKVIEC